MSSTGLPGGVRVLVAVTTLAAVALAACTASGGASPAASTNAGASGSPAASSSPAASGTLEGTPWQLTDYAGPDGTVIPVPEKVAATATFKDGRISGNSGCNTYTGTYTVSGSDLTVSGLASTQMACGPIPTAVETAFNATLAKVTTYSISGETLELKTAEGKVGMRFRAATPPSLTGTPWVATGVNNGKGGVVSMVAGSTVTATFAAAGTVSGSGGCNEYNGSYTLSGTDLTFGPLATTRKACAEAGVGDQEAQYFAALANVKTFAFNGDGLELRDAAGALQVSYEPTLAQ